MIGKFQQKYQFWDGFGKGFGRVWEGLEGIKIRWKKDVKIRGRGAQLSIAALGRNLYRGGLYNVQIQAFLQHWSKMGSKKPSGSILGRFWDGFGRFWEHFGRVL